MLGKIRQKLIALEPSPQISSQKIICPICDRSIPKSQRDAHHLVPKSKGGKTTEYLHRICHRQIHALFTETELANQLNTASALQAHPEMKKFISWVQTKPEHFYEKTRKSARVKARQAS
jgi:HNH endonuclease